MKDFLNVIYNFLNAVFNALIEMGDLVWRFICALFFSIDCYCLPIKDLVNMVLVIFAIDMVVGWWTARKLRGESFSPKIIWEKTVPRVAFSLLLIVLCFWLDTTCKQNFLPTYNYIGWFISGLVIWSIGENGYKLTKWNVFRKLGRAVEHRIEEETGFDLSKERL